ncbi:proline-serine-threonine phosphatase-interacting protein 1 isoform X3 [Delphinapterus leucas]|uniref:Proline-serine-threonine phosphatase-interacting protein 1 isoform X3 n=1 Tax=Delphinapterus leucas TaxID=9749 RepID=A0A2Y9MEP9_DELLE|nr:proline-serine-threonine phosphatase-interacting protein 1 isoform X3 [Delphinapterus leucas]
MEEEILKRPLTRGRDGFGHQLKRNMAKICSASLGRSHVDSLRPKFLREEGATGYETWGLCFQGGSERPFSTLKRALDVFKLQIDSVAQSHIQLAQTLREEARKMEEFREKQKLQRKKVGFTYVLRCCHSSSRKFQACLFVKLLDPFPTLKHPHSSFNL